MLHGARPALVEQARHPHWPSALESSIDAAESGGTSAQPRIHCVIRKLAMWPIYTV
jgi:hypothetical protein